MTPDSLAVWTLRVFGTLFHLLLTVLMAIGSFTFATISFVIYLMGMGLVWVSHRGTALADLLWPPWVSNRNKKS